MENPIRLLRRNEVEQITGLARSTIYAYMRSGDFPHPIRIGIRAVAWKSCDVEEWINHRAIAGEQP